MIKTALYILTGPRGSGSCRIRLLPSVTLVDCRLGLPSGHDYTLWLHCDGKWYRHEASRCFQWQLPPFTTLPTRPAVLDAQHQLLLCCRNDTAVKCQIARVITQEQQAAALAESAKSASADTPHPVANAAALDTAQTTPNQNHNVLQSSVGNNSTAAQVSTHNTVAPTTANKDGEHNNAQTSAVALETQLDIQQVDTNPTTQPTAGQASQTANAQQDTPTAVALETLFDIQQVDTDQADTSHTGNQAASQDTPTAVDWEKLYLGNHPLYPPLMQRMPGSRWVRIDDDDAWYVVGLLYDSNNVPTHACYGVYGRYDVQLCPQAEWLPQSVDDWHGQGYWIIYQQLQLPTHTAGQA